MGENPTGNVPEGVVELAKAHQCRKKAGGIKWRFKMFVLCDFLISGRFSKSASDKTEIVVVVVM